MEEKMIRKQWMSYTGMVFALGWMMMLLVGFMGQSQASLSSSVGMISMFAPAIAALVTKATIKDQSPLMIFFNFKGNAKYYAAAYFGPFLLSLVGMLIYFFVFPSMLDRDLSGIQAAIEETGMTGQVDARELVTSQALMMIISAPLVNLITALGEELGWRGYLFPKMSKETGLFKAMLFGSLLWGVWHFPLICMGSTYGTEYPLFPIPGLIGITLFCLAVGSIQCYMTWKVKSIIPAALFNSGINAVAALPVLICEPDYNPFIGPLPVGILGGAGLLIAGIVCGWQLWKEDEKRRENKEPSN